MTLRKHRIGLSFSAIWILCAVSPFGIVPARAETLETALALVYENNPSLNGERARLRATDEELAKAQSGYRPQVGISGDYGVGSQDSKVAPLPQINGIDPTPLQNAANQAAFKRYDGITHPGGFAVTVSQPLFEGFQTVNAVKSADANIFAARETLRDTEQRTLLGAVTAFMNVLRDAAALTLRQHALKLFASEADATRERFSAGETTRTDVAEARSRQAEAKAEVELAKANLRGSLANYQQLVGHVPTRLTDPVGFEQYLPNRVEDAIAEAVSHNPQVVSSAFLEKAAGYDVRKALGQMLPQAAIQASHSQRYEPSTLLDGQIDNSASVRFSIPLYQSGEVEAQVRQAKQQQQGRLQDIEAARDQARAQTIASFAQVQANRAQVAAIRQQIAAATESLTGMREEQKAGQRTLLDVLNTEQELINAEVSAVRAHHDFVVSAYTLLAAMGKLTAADLGLQVALYDTHKHYAETNGKWAGTSVEPEPGYAAANPGWAPAVETQH